MAVAPTPEIPRVQSSAWLEIQNFVFIFVQTKPIIVALDHARQVAGASKWKARTRAVLSFPSFSSTLEKSSPLLDHPAASVASWCFRVSITQVNQNTQKDSSFHDIEMRVVKYRPGAHSLRSFSLGSRFQEPPPPDTKTCNVPAVYA